MAWTLQHVAFSSPHFVVAIVFVPLLAAYSSLFGMPAIVSAPLPAAFSSLSGVAAIVFHVQPVPLVPAVAIVFVLRPVVVAFPDTVVAAVVGPLPGAYAWPPDGPAIVVAGSDRLARERAPSVQVV